jgi:hypothetical protein
MLVQPGRLGNSGRRLPLIPALLLVMALISTSMSDTARGSGLQQGPPLGCNATSNFFFSTLTTQQESPIPGPTGPIVNPTTNSPLTGNGFATALLNPTQTQLRVTLSYQGLTSGPKRFHTHQLVPPTPPNPVQPPPNAIGGIIIPYVEPPNVATAPDIPNPLLLPPPPVTLNLNPLAPSTLNALQTLRTQNGSYFNVHTVINPNGEIRGATICTTLTPGVTTPPCIPGQVLPFATGQASGSVTCNNPFTYTVTPNQVPTDAPVGSRPVVIIPVVNAVGQTTFDTFNCDQTISAARTVTCSGTGPAGDTVALGATVIMAFAGALSTQPTGTLQPLAFTATTINPGVNQPPVTGQAGLPCANAVGQICNATGGVTGPWTKRSSGSFAFTAQGPAATLPLSFPTVFIPTTIGVESIQCNQLPVAAPFTATCVGNTAGDALQGATITIRFILTAGGTQDVTGTLLGPGAPPAPVVPAAAAPAARQPIVIGPLLPPPPPLPPPLPPFPPLPPPGMGQMGAPGMSMMQPAMQATATPTPEPESRRGTPASNTAQSPRPASDPMPVGAPPSRPATADVAFPAAPVAPTTAESSPVMPSAAASPMDPASLMPSAAPGPGDAQTDPSSSLPAEAGMLDSVEPLVEQP